MQTVTTIGLDIAKSVLQELRHTLMRSTPSQCCSMAPPPILRERNGQSVVHGPDHRLGWCDRDLVQSENRYPLDEDELRINL